jgi:beta-lactamase regulating signal transducer with metallopeptidase domain
LDHHLATRLSALWTVGVLLVLGRLVLGTIRVNTLARAAERVTSPDMLALLQRTASRLRIARPVTLLRGDRLDVPITWGVVYPVVLLPADSEEWPEERRRVVLVHELAHVKRLDAVTQLLAQLAIAIFWFDPLVWLAARRMRAEREHACDDFVLRDGTRASLYARELLDMVRRLGRRRADVAAPAFAALAMARRTEFEGRMLAILDPDVERRTLGRAAAAALVAAAVLLLLPLAALHPFGETAHATGRALHAAAAATATGAATTVPLTVAIDRRAAAALAGSRAVAAARAPAALRSPTAAPAETLPIMYRCTRADVRANENTYAIHTDDHRPGRPFVEHYVKKYGRCRHIVLAGRVTFTPDERDVASLGADSRVQLHERTLDWERMLVVTRDADGALRRTYSSNGQAAPFDAEARAWVGGLMRDLARESGADAPGRVSRIRAAGGVPAVLADIGEIESAGAKRRHYQALLESGSLTSADVDNIVRHAGRELAGSGDLRAVLRSVPRGNRRSIDAALADAIGRMSDGDKQQVLSGMLDSADTPTLHVVLRLAEQIGSDGEKAAFLRRAAPRVLDPSNATLREAFFRTYASIGSDGEKHVVLNAALKQALKSPTITRDVIRGAVKIGSDGEKAALLRSVAKSRLLTTDELRAEYIRAARTIGSDGEFRAVIDEVLGGKG